MKTVLATFLFLVAGSSAMAACADVRPLVCTLLAPYDPTHVPYNPPPACVAAPAFANIVQNAFTLANGRLKDEICAVTNIFIVPDYSWGFWENPANNKTPGGEKPRNFVAIQQGLLATPLEQIEDSYLSTVLLHGPPNLTHSVMGAGIGTPEDIRNNKIYLGTLGVLAHEIGHIKWHRDNIYSSLPCYYDKFVQPSWSKAELPNFVTRRWAPPPPNNDVPGNTVHANHGGMRVPHPYDNPLTVADVKKIYDTRMPFIDGFVTAFAASSPEEDFVETYRLVALKTNTGFGGLTMTLNLPGAPVELLNGRNNTVVQDKMQCVSHSLFGVDLFP